MEWLRIQRNGIYQLVGFGEAETATVESKLDVTDGKCRELWQIIKAEHPTVSGYMSFCDAYRDGKKEYEAYKHRDEKRYNRHWKK